MLGAGGSLAGGPPRSPPGLLGFSVLALLAVLCLLETKALILCLFISLGERGRKEKTRDSASWCPCCCGGASYESLPVYHSSETNTRFFCLLLCGSGGPMGSAVAAAAADLRIANADTRMASPQGALAAAEAPHKQQD